MGKFHQIIYILLMMKEVNKIMWSAWLLQLLILFKHQTPNFINLLQQLQCWSSSSFPVQLFLHFSKVNIPQSLNVVIVDDIIAHHMNYMSIDPLRTNMNNLIAYKIDNPTSRILQSFFSSSSFSVTLRVPPLYLGNQARYNRSASVKTTEKILNKK